MWLMLKVMVIVLIEFLVFVVLSMMLWFLMVIGVDMMNLLKFLGVLIEKLKRWFVVECLLRISGWVVFGSCMSLVFVCVMSF